MPSQIGKTDAVFSTVITGEMDRFAYDEYTRFASKDGAANIAEGTQFARFVMSHIDCDTIPFFWQWASRFTLDNA